MKHKQKFPRGTCVRVAKDLGLAMRFFPSDTDAIVEYTYSQRYSGNDVKSYCLLLLDDSGKPTDSVSWYKEHQLTLISDDLDAGNPF